MGDKRRLGAAPPPARLGRCLYKTRFPHRHSQMAEQDLPIAARDALLRELTRVSRLHADRRNNPILAGSLERLADWQARRLRMTYADLAADPRYTAAVQF